ncbi:MAG TPA: M20/M25/M40 family metallo-hydrolase [Fimbriimonadaceae bacterium]|nr:peptidase M20 [Armatimonadota bacterium]HRD31532.1 M20/M25/M40 family metallo-hydrolase [Fimbriimonadaceae bacterium]HRE94299.1 M20/M25/M40 family metallo-hydrolase [Fimbriimonadaceae bacterium]HRI74114.1 M20/M25/M40 family metallo-hydrolase [Fimbriimonadaceae bacterium]
MVNQARLVELFKTLCLINAPALEERPAVDYVKNLLTEMGLEVVEDNAGEVIGGNAGNVIATWRGTRPDAPRIYFSAHFDTVEPTEGLVIGERDGVLYTESDTILGADDKAGMAAIIEALRVMNETDEEHGDVVLLLPVAEEIGLKGAGALDIQSLDLDFGYVLDTGPPVGTYVNRTATHDKLDITVIGKPAHAGKHPEDGINALCVAADAISQLKIGRVGPETTSNLGIVSGGTGTNVVMPSVTIKAEARSTSVEELDATVGEMMRAFEDAARRWGAKVKIDHVRHYDSYLIPEDSTVVQVGQQAARKLGFTGDLRTTLGGSDANQFNTKGVPSIVMATGMEDIHTHDEHVSIESLVQNTELVMEIVRTVREMKR